MKEKFEKLYNWQGVNDLFEEFLPELINLQVLVRESPAHEYGQG